MKAVYLEILNQNCDKRRQASANLGSWCAEGRTLPRKSPLWTTKITVPFLAKQATNSTALQGFLYWYIINYLLQSQSKIMKNQLIQLMRMRVIARHLSPMFPILSHVGWLVKKPSQGNNLRSVGKLSPSVRETPWFLLPFLCNLCFFLMLRFSECFTKWPNRIFQREIHASSRGHQDKPYGNFSLPWHLRSLRLNRGNSWGSKTHQKSVPRYDVMITCTSKDTCNHQVIIVDGSTRNLAQSHPVWGWNRENPPMIFMGLFVVKTLQWIKTTGGKPTIPGFRWLFGRGDFGGSQVTQIKLRPRPLGLRNQKSKRLVVLWDVDLESWKELTNVLAIDHIWIIYEFT